MSRRTAEASRAVKEAWEKERQLVLEGKGTRNWSSDQQKEILEKGKAYDSNGKAFEGHHMKSAEAYPEYQGDADNIQFLSREEHQNAHGGCFQNPTNGFFDPVTGTTEDFGNNSYQACKVIDLSNPVTSQKNSHIPLQDESATAKNERAHSSPPQNKSWFSQAKVFVVGKAAKARATIAKGGKAAGNAIAKAGKKVGGVARAVVKTVKEHPLEVIQIVTVAIQGVSEGIDLVERLSGNSSEQEYSNASSTDYGSGISYDTVQQNGESVSEKDLSIEKERDYPEKRKPPVEHIQHEYTRVRFGKEEHVKSSVRGRKPKDNE